MNDGDKSIMVGLILMAIFAFAATAILGVAIVAEAIQNIMIAYIPTVPILFTQVIFILFTAIVLFFTYKLFTMRWFYDYKRFENDIRKDYFNKK